MKCFCVRRPARLLAALLALALCGVTACDNGNSDGDDDDSPAPEKLTTLDGATFVLGSYTYTIEYPESYWTTGLGVSLSGGSATGQVKKIVHTYTNYEYITGTSDSTARWYSWDETNHRFDETYDSVTYRIDGDTITFTVTLMGASVDVPMTIHGADSFTYAGETDTSPYGSSSTRTDQVYTRGEAPASGSKTTVTENW